MKQPANKAQKKPDSSTTNILRNHAAIRPVLDHDVPRTVDIKAHARGRDFSQMPLNSAESARVHTNATQSCPFIPQRCPFGGACHTCPARLQTKHASISESPIVSVQRKCISCDEDEKVLQKSESNGPDTALACQTKNFPLIVNEVLLSPGRQLDVETRDFFEPRFRHDFRKVRIHAGTAAAKSAKELNAHAYTRGHHIVFGEGRFAPGTSPGRWLLAHELAHVVQQSTGEAMDTQKSSGANGPLESQADAAASAVVQGRRASDFDHTDFRLQLFPLCRALWDPKTLSQGSVAESEVRDEIIRQRRAFGPVEREFPIPGGSATPGRTEPWRKGRDEIRPQVIDPNIAGRADVAQLNERALELIEVKRAELPDLVFAEEQLLRYVFQGNRAMSKVNRHWRDRGHAETLTSVRGMPRARFTPISPQRIGGTPVSISWCRDGVMTYKAIGDRDPEIFLCGVTDRGRSNDFLDRVMDRAQTRVDEFIQNEVEARAKQMAGRSLRDAVRFIINRPEVRKIVPPGLSDEAVLDIIVRELRPYEAIIQSKANELIQRTITELRRMIKNEIRNLLQSSLNALCAKATQITARELLDEFNRRMRQLAKLLVPQAVAVAAKAMLNTLIAELAAVMAEVLAYIAAAVAVVIAAILLWEVAAAIVAAGAIETALASIGEFLVLIFSRLAF